MHTFTQDHPIILYNRNSAFAQHKYQNISVLYSDGSSALSGYWSIISIPVNNIPICMMVSGPLEAHKEFIPQWRYISIYFTFPISFLLLWPCTIFLLHFISSSTPQATIQLFMDYTNVGNIPIYACHLSPPLSLPFIPFVLELFLVPFPK